jgi:hypothetical protein
MIGLDVFYGNGKQSMTVVESQLFLEWSAGDTDEDCVARISSARARTGASGFYVRAENVKTVTVDRSDDLREPSQLEHHRSMYIRVFPSADDVSISFRVSRLSNTESVRMWFGFVRDASRNEYSLSWQERERGDRVCSVLPVRIAASDDGTNTVIQSLVKTSTMSIISLFDTRTEHGASMQLDAGAGSIVAPAFRSVEKFGSADHRVVSRVESVPGSSRVARLEHPSALQALAARTEEPALWTVTIRSAAPHAVTSQQPSLSSSASPQISPAQPIGNVGGSIMQIIQNEIRRSRQLLSTMVAPASSEPQTTLSATLGSSAAQGGTSNGWVGLVVGGAIGVLFVSYIIYRIVKYIHDQKRSIRENEIDRALQSLSSDDS